MLGFNSATNFCVVQHGYCVSSSCSYLYLWLYIVPYFARHSCSGLSWYTLRVVNGIWHEEMFLDHLACFFSRTNHFSKLLSLQETMSAEHKSTRHLLLVIHIYSSVFSVDKSKTVPENIVRNKAWLHSWSFPFLCSINCYWLALLFPYYFPFTLNIVPDCFLFLWLSVAPKQTGEERGLFNFTCYNPPSRGVKAWTEGKSLKQQPWRNPTYCQVPQGGTSYLHFLDNPGPLSQVRH